ncbi:MAG: hypothetical protein FWB80_04245 [Defluviitaleaceae bacterium]|nr:hypothetical protein [Defluviitaleaceae bacterium]
MQTVFSNADKDACLPIIDMIIKSAEIARTKGIIALEEHALACENDFYSFGIALIVSGTDPELVKNILNTLVTYGNHKDQALLERLIITDGILSIQEGQNPRIIKAKLHCFLGEEYMKERCNFPKLYDDIQEQHENAQAQKALNDLRTENENFNNTISMLSNNAIRKVLTHLEQKEIAIAVKGSHKENAIKILANLPKPLSSDEAYEITFSAVILGDDLKDLHRKIQDIIITHKLSNHLVRISYA